MKPFDGRPYLADTSVWIRRHHPRVRGALESAIAAGQVLTSPIVVMEVLASAREAAELAALDSRFGLLHELPLDRSVGEAARGAQRDLAAIGPLHHRVPLIDILIAATASLRGVGILHYDRHFDRLAEVLGFESRWVAEPGSL